jgi:hypothetical protein
MRLSPESTDSLHLAAPAGERVIGHAEPVTDDLPRAKFSFWDKTRFAESIFWQKWYAAFRGVWPVYLAVHLAIFVISCLAFLFSAQDFSGNVLPVASLWQQWQHWDANFYVNIATQGYTTRQEMAFFPLYPLLVRGVMFVTHNPIIAGILVSNMAELVMFTVLYRLVEEEFGKERSYYTVLYFAIFPSAFFFSGIYTESLFLCLSVLTFYQLRHGRWFLAGICACFASFTRPDGIYLIIPFCYEYLSRIWQQQDLSLRAFLVRKRMLAFLKGIRWDICFGVCFFGGILLFMIYGLVHDHDLLAFVHAHKYWTRQTAFPGWGMLKSAWAVLNHGFLSFTGLHNLLELGTDAFVLLIIVLMFVGPWKFSPKLWGYGFYSLALFLYFQSVPVAGTFPLESMERFLLEVFPAFILFSSLSKYRSVHLSYCLVASALLFFMLAQFLTHHWIT